jgi:hypothetical protein
MSDIGLVTDIETAKMMREIETRIRSQQLGEAFIGLQSNEPLLTAIVPDGMESPLRRKAVR